MNFDDHAAIERAAEYTFMEQGIPGLGEMSTMDSFKLGFVAGMRLAGEEILKLAQDKKWHQVELPTVDRELSASQVEAIARVIGELQRAGFGEVRLLARGSELRIGWQ